MIQRFSRHFYRFRLSPLEVDFIQKYAPMVEQQQNVSTMDTSKASLEDRMEMIKRILTKDTASITESVGHEKSLIVGKSGSLSFKIRALHVKLKQMEQHLLNNKKDISTKRMLNELRDQQRKYMKSMKTRNPLQFVELKKDIGYTE